MKSNKIHTVKFLEPIQIGPASTPYSYLSQDQLVDEHKVTITFDDDPRFVLLTLVPRPTALKFKKPSYQLIPLAVVTTILMNEDDKSLQSETKVKDK